MEEPCIKPARAKIYPMMIWEKETEASLPLIEVSAYYFPASQLPQPYCATAFLISLYPPAKYTEQGRKSLLYDAMINLYSHLLPTIQKLQNKYQQAL